MFDLMRISVLSNENALINADQVSPGNPMRISVLSREIALMRAKLIQVIQ